MGIGDCWRHDSRSPQPATEVDTFTYVGFSEQVLFVDYADDFEEIDYFGKPRGSLAVPTHGEKRSTSAW